MSVVQNLIKIYDNFSLQIPYWEFPDQGISVLQGPSGSGKSSVIRVLLGLDSCPNLSWDFKGEDLASLSVEQRRLGVVFQNYELFPHMSALQNIEFAARARKVDAVEMDKQIANLSVKLQMRDFMSRQAAKLSGGEQQRVALARALVGRPRFLFLDEPFAALDEELRSTARQLVKDVLNEYKIPALLVTHDAADVRALAEKIFKIHNGQLVY